MDIFSTYLYETKNEELADRLLKPCKDVLKKIKQNTRYINGKTTYYNQGIIKEYKIFNLLYEFIDKHFNRYLEIIGCNGENTKFVITDIWISEMNKNAIHGIHTHTPYSIISGNFYINVPNNSADIVFKSYEMFNDVFTSLVKTKDNKYNSNSFFMKAEKGKMLLWPSNLPHEVPLNNSNGRIAISFNIGKAT